MAKMTPREIEEAISYCRKQRELIDEAIAALQRIALPPSRSPNTPDLRRCNRCAEMKPLSAFHRNGPYLMSFCRDCNTERCRRYYRRNRERVNDRRRLRRGQSDVSLGQDSAPA